MNQNQAAPRASAPAHISHSGVMTYISCPEHYLFKYVMGIKLPPGKTAVRGRAMHSALEGHYRQQIQKGKGLSLKQVKDLYAHELSDEFAVHDFEIKKNRKLLSKDFLKKDREVKKAELLESGLSGIEAYFKTAPREYHNLTEVIRKRKGKPMAAIVKAKVVEEPFRIKTSANIDIIGTIDLADTKGIIRDLKTSGRGVGNIDLSEDIQLAIYEMGYEAITGKKPKGFSKDYIVFSKSGAWVQRNIFDKLAVSRKTVIGIVSNVLRAIEHNIWYCAHTPGSWVCSANWCAYRKLHQELRDTSVEAMLKKYGMDQVESEEELLKMSKEIIDEYGGQ